MKNDLEVRSSGSIEWCESIRRCDPVVRVHSEVRSRAGEGATIEEPEGIIDSGVVSWLVLYKVSTF